MNPAFSRFEALIGEDGLKKLSSARVAVFGIGGVGGEAVMALARSGIGHLDLIDHDVVAPSNINRQAVAFTDTIGQEKTEVMKEMVHRINPECEVTVFNTFFLPGQEEDFPFAQYDYVIDAIDTLSAKIALIQVCHQHNVPLVSCMGMGNKLHPECIEVGDIYQTTMDPLSKIVRQKLRKLGIPSLKVVYSKEPPLQANTEETPSKGKKTVPGSSPFVPPAAGLTLASVVVQDLLG
ncbi:MAG: tRNA threonylcarbamoyladenosine dehydratase [Bacilli bacterium]|nr:tRNA threonylcarbamoyladenosine dehydratase [Bacilli bacterium]